MWNGEQDTTYIKLQEIFLSAPAIRMPDVLLTTSGGVLMQVDSNGDLHPCAYHSQTFSLAEQNYDIYDRELLTILHTLKEWRHYLTGTAHPVIIIMDHKNLGYFKQP